MLQNGAELQKMRIVCENSIPCRRGYFGVIAWILAMGDVCNAIVPKACSALRGVLGVAQGS